LHNGWAKNFCCVTTRRRNLGLRHGLCRNARSLPARTFTTRTLSSGMLGFERIVLASSSLPLRRLPAAE
jgi:hypothetical protein